MRFKKNDKNPSIFVFVHYICVFIENEQGVSMNTQSYEKGKIHS